MVLTEWCSLAHEGYAWPFFEEGPELVSIECEEWMGMGCVCGCVERSIQCL